MMQHKLYALRNHGLFQSMSRGELHVLEKTISALLFAPEGVILREGDPADSFYLIIEGTVRVELPAEAEQEQDHSALAQLGEGMVFGEMGLFDGQPRSANIIAQEKVLCYGFSLERLRAIGAREPLLITKLLTNMAREFSNRLRAANARIYALEDKLAQVKPGKPVKSGE